MMNWWKMACVVLVHSNFQVLYMGVSKNSGTPKSSILIGFSIINHPSWGKHPYFWKHPYSDSLQPHWMSREQPPRTRSPPRTEVKAPAPTKKNKVWMDGFCWGDWWKLKQLPKTLVKYAHMLHGTEILMVQKSCKQALGMVLKPCK